MGRLVRATGTVSNISIIYYTGVMTTNAQERSTVAPSPAHKEELKALSRFLDGTPAAKDRQIPYLVSPAGDKQEIPTEVYFLLTHVVDALANDRGVSVVPTNTRLTTQQAADHLGISRPTLVKLLEQGDIPFTKVGRHRRVLLTDLVGYEKDLEERRREGLRLATQEAANDGTYFDTPTDSSTR